MTQRWRKELENDFARARPARDPIGLGEALRRDAGLKRHYDKLVRASARLEGEETGLTQAQLVNVSRRVFAELGIAAKPSRSRVRWWRGLGALASLGAVAGIVLLAQPSDEEFAPRGTSVSDVGATVEALCMIPNAESGFAVAATATLGERLRCPVSTGVLSVVVANPSERALSYAVIAFGPQGSRRVYGRGETANASHLEPGAKSRPAMTPIRLGINHEPGLYSLVFLNWEGETLSVEDVERSPRELEGWLRAVREAGAGPLTLQMELY